MTIYFNPDCKAYEEYQNLIKECKTNIRVSSRLVKQKIFTSKDIENHFSLIQLHDRYIDETAFKVAQLVFNNYNKLIDTTHTNEKDLRPLATVIQHMNAHADNDERRLFEEKYIEFKELVKTLLLKPIFKDHL